MTTLEMLKQWESGCMCEECTIALISAIRKQAIREQAFSTANKIISHWATESNKAIEYGLPILPYIVPRS